MKVEYKFAPETKDFLLLPALDEWHDLYLHSDLPVQYMESDEEGMYLKTSEDCRGSVFLNTEDGKLSLNCAMSARSMGSMRDMVLVMSLSCFLCLTISLLCVGHSAFTFQAISLYRLYLTPMSSVRP